VNVNLYLRPPLEERPLLPPLLPPELRPLLLEPLELLDEELLLGAE
jgi:hypothetical protein